MKYILFIFFLTFRSYAQTPDVIIDGVTNYSYNDVDSDFTKRTLLVIEGIRGYKFGEKLAEVAEKELKRRELVLLPELTNQNRLVYQADLFNRAGRVIFLFREKRLSSISYFWMLKDPIDSFYTRLARLLTSKYGKSSISKIPTIGGSYDMETFTKYVATTNNSGETIPHPTLTIELEKILRDNVDDPYKVYIMEFRPYNADRIIDDKILTEDL